MHTRLPRENVSPAHGGDVLGIATEFGVDPDRLIDFSANINPWGPPASVLAAVGRAVTDPTSLTRYPQPHAPHLAAKIAARFNVGLEHIIVGHGSAGLLDTIVRAFHPMRCLVPIPAFSEYHRICDAVGCAFIPFQLERSNDFRVDVAALQEAIESVKPDLVLLSNPHNPSGSLVRREDMLEIVSAARLADAIVLLDEAFIDYVPEESLLPEAAASESLIVLRSFTKFYAFPGLRVGYAVASTANARRIAHTLPSWPVSTIALIAAEAALDNLSFERTTLERNALERERLVADLTALGLRVLPSTANFLLVDCGRLASTSDALRAQLIADRGIIVRSCADYASLERACYIRIAIRNREDNERLRAALGTLRTALHY